MLTMTCNQCDNNLDDGGGYPSFRIKLSVERRPNKGGFEYAVALNPPFKVSEAHFCGAKCLGEWVLDPANSPSGFKLNVAAGDSETGGNR